MTHCSYSFKKYVMTYFFYMNYFIHTYCCQDITFDVIMYFFSSAVPPGSGAFQMPTRPSSSASASTLRGGERANLSNASVTFSFFLHEASLG